VTATTDSSSNRTRARLITAAAILVILLAGAGALLPLAEQVPGANVIGSLLLAAGLVELLAGTQRRESKILCVVAGAVTAIAGLLLVMRPRHAHLPDDLSCRSVAGCPRYHPRRFEHLREGLGEVVDSRQCRNGYCTGLDPAHRHFDRNADRRPFWTDAGGDREFSWVLALSFLVTGLWMLDTASCERESGRKTDKR
jgi:hypothetical protein